jgi:uncharacterized membrane protein
MSGTWKRWQDWATVVVGVLLFITPFVFGATTTTAAAWTAYIGGVLLVIAGLWSLSSGTNQWIEGAEVVLGVLLFIAPWVLGFSSLTNMAWSCWIAGILAVVLGGSDLVRERNRPTLVGQH